MQTQSKIPCLVLYVLLLYSMKLFEIDTTVLVDSASSEVGDFLFADEDYSAGRINQIMLPLLLVISGLLFLADGTARRLLIKKPILPLFILITALVLMASISVSETTRITIARSAGQLFFLSTVVALIYTIQDKKGLYLTAGLAFLTALVVDVALYFTLGTGLTTSLEFHGYHRNRNMAGNQYAVAAMVFVFLAITRKNPIFLIAGALSIALLIFSDSRTSMGAIGIFLIFSLLYRVPIARAFIIISTLIGTVAISIYYSLGTVNPEIFTNRGEIWNFLSPHVWSKPFLGHGFASFWDVGPQSINVVERDDFIAQINTGHNGFIDIMLGTGLLGLIVFVGFLLFTAFYLIKLDSRFFIAHYLFIAFLVSNITETYFFYFQNIMWLMLILTIGAAYTDPSATRRRRSRSSSRSSRSRSNSDFI